MGVRELFVGLLIIASVAAVVMFTPLFKVDRQESAILFSMEEAYLPNANYSDDYRCFVLDPKLDEDVFVTEFQVRPGQDALVHHAVLFVVDGSFRSQVESLDAAEDGPGWTCFGGPGDGGGGSLERALGTWAPGLQNSRYPEGTAKLLRAGALVVMQVHYNLHDPSQIAPDQTAVELYTTDDEAISSVFGYMIAAPIELQCPGEYPEDASDPCHRDSALRSVQNPGTNSAFHQRCGTNSATYLSRDVGLGDMQTSECTIRMPISGTAIGAFGHMHLRGASLLVELHPDSPKSEMLLDIPFWNFNAQDQYWFEPTLQVEQGDLVRLTCTFDNSGPIPGPDGNPLHPRYIVWGEGTTDEMCLALINWIR